MVRIGEIVGLKANTNGRSCESHDCCGESISADDLIRFRLCVLNFDHGVEEALKALRIRDGTESCVVGYLPRNVVRSRKEVFIDKFAQSIELYESSDNVTKRKKSHRNCGIASFRPLEDIRLIE